MKTSQATILVDKTQKTYFVYSPQDGIKHALSFVSISCLLAGTWRLSEYKTPDEIDSDTPYYKVVEDEGSRQLLLHEAINAYAIVGPQTR